MNSIEKARSISIWIFIVPFVAVNICLILVTQFHSLFPNQTDILHNTIPILMVVPLSVEQLDLTLLG